MQPLMSALQQTYGAEGLDVADGARLVDSIEGEPGLGGEPGAGDVGAGGGVVAPPRRAIWVPHPCRRRRHRRLQPGRRPSR